MDRIEKLEAKVKDLTVELSNFQEGIASDIQDFKQWSCNKHTETTNFQHYTTEKLKETFWNLDKCEMYSRRDSIRMYGIPEEKEEDTNKKVLNVTQAMGLTLEDKDISVSHRVQTYRKKDGPRPIICKMVKRDTKVNIMKNKRNLREKVDFTKIYIEEDLTVIRKQIVQKLKSSRYATHTKDGKIFVKDGARSLCIDTFGDFQKLQWTDAECYNLGLFGY